VGDRPQKPIRKCRVREGRNRRMKHYRQAVRREGAPSKRRGIKDQRNREMGEGGHGEMCLHIECPTKKERGGKEVYKGSLSKVDAIDNRVKKTSKKNQREGGGKRREEAGANFLRNTFQKEVPPYKRSKKLR